MWRVQEGRKIAKKKEKEMKEIYSINTANSFMA